MPNKYGGALLIIQEEKKIKLDPKDYVSSRPRYPSEVAWFIRKYMYGLEEKEYLYIKELKDFLKKQRRFYLKESNIRTIFGWIEYRENKVWTLNYSLEKRNYRAKLDHILNQADAFLGDSLFNARVYYLLFET